MKSKSPSQIALEKEVEVFRENVEKVRSLLIRNNASDLVDMLLSDLEGYPVRELSASPNGGRVNKGKKK